MDLDYNRITTTEEIPLIPEPELSNLRADIMQLLSPNIVAIDQMRAGPFSASEQCFKGDKKPWGVDHDLQLR